MTINDLELCEHYRKLFTNSSQIERLTRDGKEHKLFMALSEIEMAARGAQERLNKLNLRWPDA